jgi:hypothetical protein
MDYSAYLQNDSRADRRSNKNESAIYIRQPVVDRSTSEVGN